MVSTNCRSAGEALRVIDQKDIIKADFVLVRVCATLQTSAVSEAAKPRFQSPKLNSLSVVKHNRNTGFDRKILYLMTARVKHCSSHTLRVEACILPAESDGPILS